MQDLDLVSNEVLQQQLNLSRSTLWRLRQRGLPCHRVGRSIRYPLEQVRAWLRSNAEVAHVVQSQEAEQMSIFEDEIDTPGGEDRLLPCHWSPSVALDPKHRPQLLDSPSSTLRKDWRKYPQEAHLLDAEGGRYRRLHEDEMAILQGFPAAWGKDVGLTHRERIAGLGNAVPPPVARALYASMCEEVSDVKTAVEICAGFGGLALGAKPNSLKTLALVENWEAAVRVLRACGEWDPSAVHFCDVRDFDFTHLSEQVDILSGGPPCQPWSRAGLSRGAEDDRDLLGEMPNLVEALMPRSFIFENVPGLLAAEHHDYLTSLIQRLRSCGGPSSYGVAIGVMQAADFGVPQKRTRVIIAGIRGRSDSAVHRFFDRVYSRRSHANPAKARAPHLLPWLTIRQALPQWASIGVWHKWLSEASMESVAHTAAPKESMEKMRDAQQIRMPRMGLVWPSRGLSISWSGGHWVTQSDADALSLPCPLLPENSARPLVDPWYVRGDFIRSLESVRIALGRRAKLVYFEPPRLSTDLASFASEDVRGRLDTWLTLCQASLRRLLTLVRDDGVVAVLTGDAEQPYLQVMLDEMLGPENRIGTVVWQKGYSVQGQKKDKPKKEIYPTHDNILLYSPRREECFPGAALKAPPQNFSNPDADPRGHWKAEQKGANYHRQSSDFCINLPPYRWEVVGEKKPEWFWRISPKSGVIWAPAEKMTTPGQWTIRIRVTDSVGSTFEKDFSVRVVESGVAPQPQAPSWLIARDASGNLTNEDSPNNAPKKGGRLGIATKELPSGVAGNDYFACLEATGGQPWTGTTRPGKNSEGGRGRYWDLSFDSLERAAALDAVDFKSNDSAIPAAKVYLDGASFTYLNQISTWRGDGRGKENGAKDAMRVGWGQDAKKELEDLLRVGVIKRVITIGKPAGLAARIVSLFTDDSDFVIDAGSSTAEVASIACQLRRNSIYVEMPGTEADGNDIRVPRLTAAARGEHPLPEGVLFLESSTNALESGYFAGKSPRIADPAGHVCLFGLGPPFATQEGGAGATISYASYPPESTVFLQALSSIEGLVWNPGPDGSFACSHDRHIRAFHVSGTEILDGRYLQDLAVKIADFLLQPRNRVRIYYHRGYGSMSVANERLELRHLPFELSALAHIWQ